LDLRGDGFGMMSMTDEVDISVFFESSTDFYINNAWRMTYSLAKLVAVQDEYSV
jgi:hypothetical protein